MLSTDFSALVASRRSTRDFTDRTMPDSVLEEILADAAAAPSWSNTRPYMLGLAVGEDARALTDAYCALFDAHTAARAAGTEPPAPDGDFAVWARYPDDLRPRSVELGVALYEALGIERGDRAARDAWTRRNFEAFGAPVVGLVYVHEALLPFSALDAGIMFSTLALAAKARGVDSCPLGNLAVWRAPGDRMFSVPAEYRLVTGFALGYASDAPVNSFAAARRPIALAPRRGAEGE